MMTREEKEDSTWDAWLVETINKIRGQKQRAGLDRIYSGVRLLTERDDAILANQKSPIAPIYQIPVRQIGIDSVEKHLLRAVKSGLLQRVTNRGSIFYKCSEGSDRVLNLHGISQDEGEILMGKCLVKCMRELSEKDPGSDMDKETDMSLTFNHRHIGQIIDYIRHSYKIQYPPGQDQVSYLGLLVNRAIAREVSNGQFVQVGDLYKYNALVVCKPRSNSNSKSTTTTTTTFEMNSGQIDPSTAATKISQSVSASIENREIGNLSQNTSNSVEVGRSDGQQSINLITSCTPNNDRNNDDNYNNLETSGAVLNNASSNDDTGDGHGESTSGDNISPIIGIDISGGGGGRSRTIARETEQVDIEMDFIEMEVVKIDFYNEEIHGIIPYDTFNYDENVKYTFEAQFDAITELIPGPIKTGPIYITPNGLKWQIGIKLNKSMGPRKLYFCLLCENQFSPFKEVKLDVIFNLKRTKCSTSQSAFCQYHKKGSSHKMSSEPGSILTCNQKEKNVFNHNNYISLQDIMEPLNHYREDNESITVEVIFNILSIQNLPQVSSLSHQKQNPHIRLDKLEEHLFLLYSEKLLTINDTRKRKVKKRNQKVSSLTIVRGEELLNETDVVDERITRAGSEPNVIILPTRTRSKTNSPTKYYTSRSVKKTPSSQAKVDDWLDSHSFSDADEPEESVDASAETESEPAAIGQIIENILCTTPTSSNNITSTSTNSGPDLTGGGIDSSTKGIMTIVPSFKIRENQNEVKMTIVRSNDNMNLTSTIDQVAKGLDFKFTSCNTPRTPPASNSEGKSYNITSPDIASGPNVPSSLNKCNTNPSQITRIFLNSSIIFEQIKSQPSAHISELASLNLKTSQPSSSTEFDQNTSSSSSFKNYRGSIQQAKNCKSPSSTKLNPSFKIVDEKTTPSSVSGSESVADVPLKREGTLEPRFKTKIVVPLIGSFNASVFDCSHNANELDQPLFPNEVPVVERINPAIVWDIIDKMEKSKKESVIVFRLEPESVADKEGYMKFFTYLSSRDRLGVLGSVVSPIKDVYILPLGQDTPIHKALLPFHGPGLPSKRTPCLLAIVTMYANELSIPLSIPGDVSKRKSTSGSSPIKAKAGFDIKPGAIADLALSLNERCSLTASASQSVLSNVNANEPRSSSIDQHMNSIIEAVAVVGSSNSSDPSTLVGNNRNTPIQTPSQSQNQRKGRKFLQKSAISVKRQKREQMKMPDETNNETRNQDGVSTPAPAHTQKTQQPSSSSTSVGSRDLKDSIFKYSFSKEQLEASSSTNSLNDSPVPESFSFKKEKKKDTFAEFFESSFKIFDRFGQFFNKDNTTNTTTGDTTTASDTSTSTTTSDTTTSSESSKSQTSNSSDSDSSGELFMTKKEKLARKKEVRPKKVPPVVLKIEKKVNRNTALCSICLKSFPKSEISNIQRKKMCSNCIQIQQRAKPNKTSKTPKRISLLQLEEQIVPIIRSEESPSNSNLSSNEYSIKTRRGGKKANLTINTTTTATTTKKNKKSTTQPRPKTVVQPSIPSAAMSRPPTTTTTTQPQSVVHHNVPFKIPRPVTPPISEEVRLATLIQDELQKVHGPDPDVLEDLISRQEEAVRNREREDVDGQQPGPSRPRTEEEVPENNLNNDCPHYFKPNGCLMGSECQIGRHSEAARGSFIECPEWKTGNCDEWILCAFRHMNQADIDNHKRKYIDNPEDEIPAKRAKLDEKVAEPAKPTKSETTVKTISCPVCLEDYDSLMEKNLKLVITQCGHPLCSECCSDLMKKKATKQNNCPICRTKLTKKATPCFF